MKTLKEEILNEKINLKKEKKGRRGVDDEDKNGK